MYAHVIASSNIRDYEDPFLWIFTMFRIGMGLGLELGLGLGFMKKVILDRLKLLFSNSGLLFRVDFISIQMIVEHEF